MREEKGVFSNCTQVKMFIELFIPIKILKQSSVQVTLL